MTRAPRPAALLIAVPLLALAACGTPAPEEAPASGSAPSSSRPPAPSPSSSSPSSSSPVTASPSSGADASPSDTTEAPSSPATRSGQAAAAGPCHITDLAVSLEPVPGGADAQASTSTLSFANEGPDCTLSGHPVVTYQAAEGEILGAPARHAGSGGSFTLAAGATATVEVRAAQAGKFGPECQPAEAHLLAVALRDGGATRYLDHEATACRSADAPLLAVGPYTR